MSADVYTPETYIDPETRPYPFCPGCSHTQVLDRVAGALAKVGVPPEKAVIVTDIGCIGISDKHFNTHTFHGLHGRSVTYATGLKMANPDLTVVVLLGDGALGIGGHHFLNAARRNVDITVVVANNHNFGMTGGQHSVTTPSGGITATTAAGNMESSIDICGLVKVAGGNFAARCFAFDAAFEDLIAEGIRAEGFAAVDAWEICVAYFGKVNKVNRTVLQEMMTAQGFETGVVHRLEKPGYLRACAAVADRLVEAGGAAPQLITPRFAPPFQGRRTLVMAGRAGQKVISTGVLLGKAAMLSGLHAMQRDDYPVTVMTGHSVADIVLEDREIHTFVVEVPDFVLISAAEGRAQLAGGLADLPASTRIFTIPELADLDTSAWVSVLDPDALGLRLTRTNTALALMGWFVRETGVVSMDALLGAVDLIDRPAVREENLKTLAPFLP
ncbi:MAG: thiamine pyrophosphate-dependent enzyme [Pseudomonadota bacterium]